jgi:hypothetical protein
VFIGICRIEGRMPSLFPSNPTASNDDSKTRTFFSARYTDYGDASFSPFVDDYIGSAVDFDAQFTFLHEKHFPSPRDPLLYDLDLPPSGEVRKPYQ